jgi:hypothetical protein
LFVIITNQPTNHPSSTTTTTTINHPLSYPLHSVLPYPIPSIESLERRLHPHKPTTTTTTLLFKLAFLRWFTLLRKSELAEWSFRQLWQGTVEVVY